MECARENVENDFFLLFRLNDNQQRGKNKNSKMKIHPPQKKPNDDCVVYTIDIYCNGDRGYNKHNRKSNCRNIEGRNI